MRGPDGVRDAIADLLSDVLPAKSEALRRVFRLSRTAAPDVDNVSYGELAESVVGGLGDVYLEVINPRLMSGMRRVDVDQGYPVYQLRYSCRIYVWAIGADWPNSIERRDHTVNTVRQILLEYPCLSTAPGDTGYLMHHDTYTEEYGSPVRVDNQSGRTWASAMAAIDMWSEESTRPGALRPPLGEVRGAALGTSVLGPTEAMPEDLPAPDQFVPIMEGSSSGR